MRLGRASLDADGGGGREPSPIATLGATAAATERTASVTTITSIAASAALTPTYNLQTAGEPDRFADRILVHDELST